MALSRRHLWIHGASTALLAALVAALWQRTGQLGFALGSGALAALGLWRPQLGALAVVALAAPDLVGSVELGRFTVRASQVAALGAALGALGRALVVERLRQTVREVPLALWLMLGFGALAAGRVLLGEVPNPGKGVAYAAWSLISTGAIAGGLWAALESRADVERALRVSVLALATIACLGLLQWTIGALGGDPPLVTQWMEGLPRINGLSYEPSYFAFSTTAGLALALAAVLWQPGFLAPLPAALAGAAMVVALLLSSSRSGWIGLALLSGLAGLATSLRWRTLGRAQRRALAVLGAGYLLAAGLLATTQLDSYARMARRGLDLEERSSSAPRLEGVQQALAMFRAHPLLGVGIGQFGGALAEARALDLEPQRMDQLVTFNLYAELLAEDGLFGLLLVLAALLLVARACWQLVRSAQPRDQALGVALATAGALVFGVMFQFNQTLFRTDVWCLIGLALAARRAAAGSGGERPA
jgi:O-antigen ligase